MITCWGAECNTCWGADCDCLDLGQMLSVPLALSFCYFKWMKRLLKQSKDDPAREDTAWFIGVRESKASFPKVWKKQTVLMISSGHLLLALLGISPALSA